MQVSKPVLVNNLKKVVSFIPKLKSSTSASIVVVDPLEDAVRISLSYPEAAMQTTVGALSELTEKQLRISGPQFLSIVSSADREIIFEADDNFATIRSGQSVWKEPMPTGTVPKIVRPEKPECVVDAYTLLTALNTVKYAIDSDSVRPALYMVDVIDGRVRACNGFQYHEVNNKVPGMTFSIPGGMVDSFGSVLRYFDGDISFYSDDNSYYFENGSDIISIHKLSSRFPDLDKLLVRPLKSEVPALLKINKNKLVTAIKRVKLALDDTYPYVELHINKSEVVVRGTQKSGAEAATSVPANWASKPRVATFNVTYLMRTLASLPEEDLELRFGNDTKTKKSPMVMEGVGSWMMLNQSNLSKRA